jgi:hypothetical protein
LILSKENILGSVDYEIHKVNVPKWGGEVCLRPFTAKLKDKLEMIRLKQDARVSIRAISLAGSICNEKGELIFGESDVNALAEKDGESVDIVLQKIFEINGLTEDELEEKVKN